MVEWEEFEAEVITVKSERVIEEFHENGWTYEKAEITFDDPKTGDEKKSILERYYLTIDLKDEE